MIFGALNILKFKTKKKKKKVGRLVATPTLMLDPETSSHLNFVLPVKTDKQVAVKRFPLWSAG